LDDHERSERPPLDNLAHKVCPSCSTRAALEHRFCPNCGHDLAEVEAREGDPYIGMVIAERYEITDTIGAGAMGAVYKAEQTTLHKPFAIKILHPHLMSDPDSQGRFANEAHNSASLNHPNVVSVVDYGRTEDGITYLVMEFIEGLPLEDIIQQQFPLARDRIIDLAVQILAALTEAHGLGILHRDLKPENILVQQLRTHGELLKVLDFGIAKLMDGAPTRGAQAGLTSQGVVCGTPEFMSPEQARGLKLDGRSDLYAVGVILYQMLCGRVPFSSESAIEILHKHIHEAPVAPHEITGGEPDPLEEVALRALSKNREDRFTSAEEFRDALVAASRQVAAVLRCASCGSEMRSDDRFCATCGTPAPKRTEAVASPRRPTRLSEYSLPAQGNEQTAETVLRAFPLPLTGRDALVERLRAMFSDPKPELISGGFTGPAGIGKTRMLDEAAALAESLGWHVHAIGCEPTGSAPAMWPIRRIIGQLFDVDPYAVTTQDLGRTANLLGLSIEVLPGLAELFRLSGPAADAEFAVRRRECFSAVAQTLVSSGRGSPVLLIFDDIDLYDAASRRVLQRLVRTHTATPVVVLVASAEPDLGWLGVRTDALEPLTDADVRSVIERAVAGQNPDSELPERLAAAKPGTPLHLEQQLRLVAEGQPLSRSASDVDLVLARLTVLPAGDRQVLEVATVLGQRLSEEDLSKLVSSDSRAPSGWEYDEALARLHVSGLLVISGRGERAFGHALVREVVYQSLPEPRRRALHATAAERSALANRSDTVRAMHLLRAGSTGAVDVLEAASRRASASFDDRKAVSLLRAAIRACQQLPADERSAREGRLTAALADMLRFTQAKDDAINVAQAALANAKDTRTQALLNQAVGRAELAANKPAQAIGHLQRALGPCIAEGDPAAILGLYADLGRGYAALGDPERAIRELTEGLDMCTFGGGPRADVDFPIWRYLLGISQLMRKAGKLRDARTWCEHALYQAERCEDSLGLLRCHSEKAWILREAQQGTLAEQHLARALDQARHFGDRLTTAEILLERARVRAARGQLEDARRYFDEALRLSQNIEWRQGISHAQRAIETLDRHASAQ
jgi:serine/threonine-protein kinase